MMGKKPRVPLGHGSNISSAYGEERGLLGVFLASCSRPRECHFLSTHYVFSGPHESPVQTFSHLDTLRQLANIFYGSCTGAIAKETECELVLGRVKSNVATLPGAQGSMATASGK